VSDKTAAIVTGTVDVGETSRIVRLLTPDLGRVSAVARGARGWTSKLAAALEPGTRLSLTLSRGRGELAYLRGVDVVASPRRARTDLDRLLLLGYGCEFCAGLAPEHHEAHKLHGLLAAFLDRLETDPMPGDATRQALEAKALTFAGVAPALLR
jgi:DNA repair protein RecO (recombination protein O)